MLVTNTLLATVWSVRNSTQFDGYTTGKGMGMGLSGSKRLVNEFDLWTQVGEGTRITIARWK